MIFRFDFTVTKDELEEICSDFGGNLRLPDNFVQTAAPHNAAPPGKGADVCERTATHVNAQTTLLCEMVGLSNPVALLPNRGNNTSGFQPADNSAADNSDFVNSTFASSSSFNPDEISLDDCENDAEVPDKEDDPPCLGDRRRSASGFSNPGEILLGKPEGKAASDEDCESFSPQVKRQSLDRQQDPQTSLEETGHCVKDSETEPEINSPPGGGKKDETVISLPISESTPKIFKRRNQAIYASRDNDPE